jgi:hypothetical protein
MLITKCPLCTYGGVQITSQYIQQIDFQFSMFTNCVCSLNTPWVAMLSQKALLFNIRTRPITNYIAQTTREVQKTRPAQFAGARYRSLRAMCVLNGRVLFFPPFSDMMLTWLCGTRRRRREEMLHNITRQITHTAPHSVFNNEIICRHTAYTLHVISGNAAAFDIRDRGQQMAKKDSNGRRLSVFAAPVCVSAHHVTINQFGLSRYIFTRAAVLILFLWRRGKYDEYRTNEEMT